MGILWPQPSPTVIRVLASITGDFDAYWNLRATKVVIKMLSQTTGCDHCLLWIPIIPGLHRLKHMNLLICDCPWMTEMVVSYAANIYISKSSFYQSWYSDYLKTGPIWILIHQNEFLQWSRTHHGPLLCRFLTFCCQRKSLINEGPWRGAGRLGWG